MVLEISLPWSKKGSVEDLVFTILIKEYPLRIIDLMNFIRKRYGKQVTFQAVRKSVLQLLEREVLIEENSRYKLNKEWILKSKNLIDSIYAELTNPKSKPKNIESIKGEISVFSFNSLNELMRFWQDLIDDWFKKFKKRDYNFNCYQSAHGWEALLHPEIEKKIMEQLKKKGIKSYVLTPSNTPLDKQIKNFYSEIGVKTYIAPSNSSFDKSYYVGTYGDLIIQCQYPLKIVQMLDDFFKKSKSLYKINLIELSNIVNKKIPMKLTVIKDLAMAKQINNSIISQM